MGIRGGGRELLSLVGGLYFLSLSRIGVPGEFGVFLGCSDLELAPLPLLKVVIDLWNWSK